MNLTNRQKRQLEKIIASAQAVLEEAAQIEPGKGVQGAKRIRRSGKELAAFRKMLKAERKKGVPVAEIARKNNISPAYIYQL